MTKRSARGLSPRAFAYAIEAACAIALCIALGIAYGAIALIYG